MIARQSGPCRVETTHLLAEARNALHIHHSLGRLLEALMRLSLAQLEVESEEEWNTLLQRKQILLDELEQQQLGSLVQQARHLITRLREANHIELAEQLQDTVLRNRERFTTLAENEYAVQISLQNQVDEMRETLVTHQHQHDIRHTYRQSDVEAEARFVNRWS